MSPTAATRARSNKAAEAPAEEAAAPKAAAPVKETDNQKRNRLRNEAERHILNAHKDEFDDFAEALFAENGLTFNRRLSEAQKAEKKINDLIAEHPELADVLRAKFAAEHPVTDAEPAPYEDAIEASVPTPYNSQAPVEVHAPGYSYADGPSEADPFDPAYNQQ